MKENEEKLSSTAAQKEKIRQRYRGVNSDELDVIPAIPQTNFYEDQREKRVAVYARVSTDDPRQTSSYELQKNHYQDVVSRHPGWKLIEIYADEGISGTSLQHRDSFVRMIDDCKAGKIDLIVTKSVSRFARNVLDCIGYVRKLAAMTPPIGIFFETENIYTLNANSEMSLSFISTLAQEESHNKSEIMNASIEMRFRRGIFLTPPLLGYDQDEDGNLIINEEEAKTVRLIFFMYLYGYTCQEIADTLTKLGRLTKKGNSVWAPGSILQILQNERHCGDVLSRKTWTPSYLDHKSKKNRQDRNQYLQRNHHEAIISRDDFIAVQRLITNAKYGNKGILPELQVITEGILCGFVSINPRWSGFKAADYRLASESVSVPSKSTEPSVFQASQGELDLRGYEVARAQFFNTGNKLCLTFSVTNFKFTQECIRKFNTPYVEILVRPSTMLLAVRPVTKEHKNAIQWSKRTNGVDTCKTVAGRAILPNLYELFGWDVRKKYRVTGVKKQYGSDAILLFDISDAEILIPHTELPKQALSENNDSPNIPSKPLGTTKTVLAYPLSWTRSFGNNYYRQAQADELLRGLDGKSENVQAQGTPYYPEPPLNTTSKDEIKQTIDSMLENMTQEEIHERTTSKE